MAISTRVSIVISRPVEDVWAYLADPAHDPVWRRPYVRRVTRLSAGPTGVGSRFAGVRCNGLYISEITAYKAPLRISWVVVSSAAGPLRERAGSYLLSPCCKATRMTLELLADDWDGPEAAAALLTPALLTTTIVPRLLSQLRAAVEETSEHKGVEDGASARVRWL